MRGARIIGPNCLGVIVPEVCKMGGIGGPAKDAAKAYAPGPVGVMSRSGGMTTEISSSLTAAGLGVSTAVSIGGDAIIGSTYAELMPLFEADEQTEAIVIYTEPGGRMEAQLAEWVKENDSRLPIVAFMAGKFMDSEEMKGMSFGHAGTIVEGEEDTAAQKIARLEGAGIKVVERIDEIPDAVKQKLGAAVVAEKLDAIFIEVEVDESVAGDAELAAKLEEVCPVDIFSDGGGSVDDRRGEPRRVRPLRALHRGRARRGRSPFASSTTARRSSSAASSQRTPAEPTTSPTRASRGASPAGSAPTPRQPAVWSCAGSTTARHCASEPPGPQGFRRSLPGPPMQTSWPRPPTRTSLPRWPSRVSSPLPPRSLSAPPPPLTVSSPPREQIRSSPPRPTITSSPEVPMITSGPRVPRKVPPSPERTSIVARLPWHLGVFEAFLPADPALPEPEPPPLAGAVIVCGSLVCCVSPAALRAVTVQR